MWALPGRSPPRLCPTDNKPPSQAAGSNLGQGWLCKTEQGPKPETCPGLSAGVGGQHSQHPGPAERAAQAGVDTGHSGFSPMVPETRRTRRSPGAACSPTLTSRLDASRHCRLAAPARRRWAWRRYQRWMVMAAWFTWWMNLPAQQTQDRGGPRAATDQVAERQPLQAPGGPSRAEQPAATRAALSRWPTPPLHNLVTPASTRKEPRDPPPACGEHYV